TAGLPPDPTPSDPPRGRFAARALAEPGTPLAVCLHGFPDNPGTFDDLLGWLVGHGFRAVAPYRRGYAPSPLVRPAGESDLYDTLAKDLLAVGDALAPGAPQWVVGHGTGAFAAYRAMALAPDRFARGAARAAGCPAGLSRAARWSPRWWWRTRGVFVFESYTRRNDFTYIEELWRRWSPGWEPPAEHLAAVKRTLAASWPEPLHHHWAGGPSGDWRPIRVPTLYLGGQRDRWTGADLAAAQERYFTGPFRSEIVPGAGHFLHLEQPATVAHLIVDWLATPCTPIAPRARKKDDTAARFNVVRTLRERGGALRPPT